MKFLKFIITTIIIIGGLGYGLYYFGTNIASDKVMDTISEELENSGQLNELKQMVNNDPELKRLIEDGANVDESSLPFHTKEQAMRTIVKKVGIGELQTIQANFQNGMSNDEKMVLLQELEGKLTDDEILALKVIAYKELIQ